MLFALICTDKPGHLQVRLDNRPAHVEFLNGLGDALKAAGPFLDEAEKPNGSLVVIEAADLQEAQGIAARDPYALAGLFDDVQIKPWNWVFKAPNAA